MRRGVFSSYHPAVIFCYFAAAIALCMSTHNPLCVAVSLLCSGAYAIFLLGARVFFKKMRFMLLAFLLVALINPLTGSRGLTVLVRVGDFIITLESLIYGICSGGMLLSMMIWFLCYCEVMSSDKFLAIFGKVAPTISLLISMILRYIPDTMRRGEEIRTAQAAMLGGETLSRREKTAQGVRMASILMSWSIESSIETADSMRARGYGTARRTSAIYQPLCATDIILLCLLLAMTAAMCAILLLPRFKFEFYPVMSPMHISAAWCIYPALLLIPLILEAKEVVSCRLYR